MTDPVEDPILDLVDWVARKTLTYSEAMDAWRTSCPTLPIWEDAAEHQLVETSCVNGRWLVRATPAGLALLMEKRPQAGSTFAPL